LDCSRLTSPRPTSWAQEAKRGGREKKARPITLAGLDLPNSTYYFLRDVFLLERFFAVFFFGLLRALATVPSFCSKVAKV
jgi:hypothetical protein